MYRVKKKNIKWGVYTSPQTKGNEFERYVIETVTDLYNFMKEFPEIKKFGVATSMLDTINKGDVVLATDRHHITGFPTWCFESDPEDKHPSAFIRVKLGKIENK